MSVAMEMTMKVVFTLLCALSLWTVVFIYVRFQVNYAVHQKIHTTSVTKRQQYVNYKQYHVVLGLHSDESRSEYLDLLIVVPSSYNRDAAGRRSVIRRTWANGSFYPQYKTRHVFVMGRNSRENFTSVQNESALYNDIVVFDFEDTYRNLTIKTLTSLHWAVNTFNTSFILKVDDDIFPYVGELLKLLKNRTSNTGNFLLGDCESNTKVNRKTHSKVYISFHDYPDVTWPAFCFGTAYVISSLAVDRLLAHTNETRLYHLEDVSLGLLARKSKETQLLDVDRWKSEQTGSGNRCPETYTYHSVNPVTMETLWNNCVMNSSGRAVIYTEDEVIRIANH